MFCVTSNSILTYSLIVINFSYYCVSENNEKNQKSILFFHSFATASHRTSIWPLAEKLADAGYNITYVFPISRRPGSHPRIEELKPSKMFAAADHFVGDFDINIRLNNTQDKWLADAFLVGIDFCEAFYTSPETHEWLARPGLHYDLVMMDGALGQCAYGLVHKFRAKHILFNPIIMPFHWDSFGVVPEASSNPEMMFHQKPNQLQMSLWSRLLNTLATFFWRAAFLNSLRSCERIVREQMVFNETMPSFEEMEQETSLVLYNAHFIEDYPLSVPPMFVSYSGLLCSKKERSKRKPLPKNLETFVEDTTQSRGFVYVSFGSSILLSAMPTALRNHFFLALESFPQLRFLVKWTGKKPENVPDNVWLQSWYPQQDVLGHPRIKAFITQAGRPSTQEALCYGVPMITIPIFADQDLNADRLEQIGAAIQLDITSLTSDTLINAIQEISENSKYKERVSELSTLFRDRPQDPLDNAFYWVEYVLKYNTSLLKPLGRHQSWWQRRLLDVYLLILVIVLCLVILVVLGIVWVFRVIMQGMQSRSACKKVIKSE